MTTSTRHASWWRLLVAARVLAPLILLGVVVGGPQARAGTTIINVMTEGFGDVVRLGTPELRNLNGAMVWNGSEWIVNTTYAHRYYIDVRDGSRLKDYASTDVTVSGRPTPGTEDCRPAGFGDGYPSRTFEGHQVSSRAYWYTKDSPAGLGTTCFGAVETTITDPAGKQVVLRSRGAGGGAGNAYFDVLIDDEKLQTTALLGDPGWYTFPGVRARDAALIEPDEAHRTGSLSGAVTKLGTNEGDYYLDIGGGSDLGPAGIGRSFELHTAPLPGGLGTVSPAYIVRFELKWMDAPGKTVFAETFTPAGVLHPGVASSSGSGGTRWRSEAVLHNPDTTPAQATLDLIPRDAAAVTKSAQRTVSPGQTVRIPDVYADLGAASGAGMLRVRGGVPTWVRTFNQGSPGTFGQDAPGASQTAFGADTDVLFPVSTPADPAEEFRSNLLLLNLESAPITFTLTASGKSATRTVAGGTYTQIDKVGTFLQLPAGLVVLAVRATGRWAGTVSTVDPGSGDPTTVRGLLPTTQSVVLFPGVASLAGSLSTQWRSEAVLYNPGTAARTVLLEILPKDGSTVAASTSVQLQPKAVRSPTSTPSCTRRPGRACCASPGMCCPGCGPTTRAPRPPSARTYRRCCQARAARPGGRSSFRSRSRATRRRSSART
ncbi:MAG: hypothetical protein MUF10_20225 [Thermoanaerobaculaceae bacterium]|nr:hypothetical protein [Thermoanaerobaculaceae bacterium]